MVCLFFFLLFVRELLGELRAGEDRKRKEKEVCQVKRTGAFVNPSRASRPSQFDF